MILIDTGFIIPLVREQDELRPRVMAWADSLHEPLLLPEYVALEAMNALTHPRHRVAVHALVTIFRHRPDCEFVYVDEPLLERGLRRYADRPDKTWSLTDCVSFLTMEDRQVDRALSHDHHFEQAGFEALLRRDPD